MDLICLRIHLQYLNPMRLQIALLEYHTTTERLAIPTAYPHSQSVHNYHPRHSCAGTIVICRHVRSCEISAEMVQRLFLLAEIGNFTPGELEQYYKSLNNMGDYYNILHTAKEEAERIGLEKGLEKGLAEGREKGLAEGRAEGRIEALLEMARKMLAAGMPVEQIAELTGLAVETLCELQ